jgi:hypothetical protein
MNESAKERATSENFVQNINNTPQSNQGTAPFIASTSDFNHTNQPLQSPRSRNRDYITEEWKEPNLDSNKRSRSSEAPAHTLTDSISPHSYTTAEMDSSRMQGKLLMHLSIVKTYLSHASKTRFFGDVQDSLLNIL